MRSSETARERGGRHRWTEEAAAEALGESPAVPAFVPVRWPVAARGAVVTPTIEIISGDITVRAGEELEVEHVARLVEALASRVRGC